MNIYTSYFANIRKLRSMGIVPINIALYKPKWFEGISLAYVAPTRYMLKGDLTRDEYISSYKDNVLSKVRISDFLSQIEHLSEGKDVALCCYEKPEDFCHRHLLAEWIMENSGIKVFEFGETPPEPKKEVSSQLELF